MKNSERILDPIHGLIRFNRKDEADETVWEFLNTAPFQRLRRVKQLGFADFVFPGATHSRFSHSIGVFHMARRLANIIKNQLGSEFNAKFSANAQFAALLHDIGHGPFSHAFETSEKKLGIKNKHEDWTEKIITENECFKNLLGGERLEEIIAMIKPKNKSDCYHAIVSSQFDADRLDYLQRDKYMSGVGTGGFDCDWLLDCLEIVGGRFVLNQKSMHNAEEYLLARYNLHLLVYAHRTVRAAEMMLVDILSYIANDLEKSGLAKNHPLISYFQNRNVENYLALDDIIIWQSLIKMGNSTKDEKLKTLCVNLYNRQFYKCFDVSALAENEEDNSQKIKKFLKELHSTDNDYAIDEPEIIGYKEEEEEESNKIKIGDKDIVDISNIVKTITTTKKLCRVYSAKEEHIDHAKKLWQEIS